MEMLMDNSKIERAAIKELEDLELKHKLLSSKFQEGDKDMSWDGWISLHNAFPFSKKTFEGKVPVQIKGHIVNSEEKKVKYLNKSTINYSVKIDDLKVYFKDRGCLYFQIFITEDLEQASVYCCNLFLTKIKGLLDEAEKEGNNDSISPEFHFLRAPVYLFRDVKQFLIESKKQGDSLVRNAIPYQDITESDILSTEVIAFSKQDFLEQISNGRVGMYVQKPGQAVEIPMKYIDQKLKVALQEFMHSKVFVNGTVFYDGYIIEQDVDGNQKLIFSENIIWDITNNTMKFKIFDGNLNTISQDLKFILAIKKYHNFEIKNNKFETPQIPKNHLNNIEILNDICDILHMLKITLCKSYKELSKQEQQTLMRLVNVYRLHQTLEAEEYGLIKIDGKYMVFVAYYDNNKVVFENAFYCDKYYLIEKEDVKLPHFCALTADRIQSLYSFEYQRLSQQLKNLVINDSNYDYLNSAVLEYLKAYDELKNMDFINIAEDIVRKIERYNSNNNLLLNKFQIKRRKGILNEDDKRKLYEMKQTGSDPQSLCAISILLENYYDANMILDGMSKEEKELFCTYPIYNLLRTK